MVAKSSILFVMALSAVAINALPLERRALLESGLSTEANGFSHADAFTDPTSRLKRRSSSAILDPSSPHDGEGQSTAAGTDCDAGSGADYGPGPGSGYVYSSASAGSYASAGNGYDPGSGYGPGSGGSGYDSTTTTTTPSASAAAAGGGGSRSAYGYGAADPEYIKFIAINNCAFKGLQLPKLCSNAPSIPPTLPEIDSETYNKCKAEVETSPRICSGRYVAQGAAQDPQAAARGAL